MFLCPNDQTTLERHQQKDSTYWACPACGGRTATLAQLRRLSRRTGEVESLDRLWGLTRSSAAEGTRCCPACERPMRSVSVPAAGGLLPLDICTRCYFVWFDPGEFEALPPVPPSREAADRKLPLEARLLLAKMEVEALDTHPYLELPPSDPPPEGWQAIPAFFGLPIREDSRPLVHQPWGTWMLAGAVALFSLLALLDLNDVARDFGLVPAELLRYGGLTLLTSMFLHGSLPHLAGNLYFLVAFGDDVEDCLGMTPFLLLLGLSTVAGSVSHAVVHAGSAVPLIGSSAAISGMLTCYGLQFPRARIGVLMRLPQLFFLRWINLRAWVYVIGWIALQAIGTWRQSGPITQVSPLAHLGGAATGFLFWFLWPTNEGPGRPAGGESSGASAGTGPEITLKPE